MSDLAKRCLIVDDSKIVRKVTRKIFEPLGFEIDEAENGQAAFDACQIAMPDIIMLDWNMPVMDGLEFLKKLRASESGQAPAVIFCSTENDFTKISAAMQAGANEYVMKPFDESIIKGKLEQLGLI